MKKSKSFNPELWSNILQYENTLKLAFQNVTIKDLQETFSLTPSQAKLYYTLLSHKDKITASVETDITVTKLKHEFNVVKKDKENLIHQVEELYNALNLVYNTKIDPSKIEQISSDTYLIEKVSDLGFFTVLSDAHVEETVRKESTFGNNEYNLDIARQRLLTYFCELDNRANKHTRSIHTWADKDLRPQLCIHLAGDFITGWIHPEGVETNSLSPAEAIVFAESCILSGLEMLLKEQNFSKITIVCTAGNHARITDKKRYATGYRNSFEHIMYNHIKQYIETNYDNVDVLIAEGEFLAVNFMGKIICCSHGDHFRYAGGIGGLLVPAIRWVHKMSQIINADLFSIGHWHGYMALPDSKLLVNGSVIGPSAFSIGLAFKPEPPKMQLQHVDSVKGFTTNDPIFLT